MPEPLCPCGEPLHYSDPETRRVVEEIVTALGELQPVTVGLNTWLVPRHFIALHGFKGAELPALAERYGWSKVG